MEIQSLSELKNLISDIKDKDLQDQFTCWMRAYCHPVRTVVDIGKPYELLSFREQLNLRARLYQSMAEGMCADPGMNSLVEAEGNQLIFKAIVLRLNTSFDVQSLSEKQTSYLDGPVQVVAVKNLLE